MFSVNDVTLMPFLEHYITLTLIKNILNFNVTCQIQSFFGTILNAQNMQETDLYLNNSQMCWLDKSFASK
jgi:hypothetical protein